MEDLTPDEVARLAAIWAKRDAILANKTVLAKALELAREVRPELEAFLPEGMSLLAAILPGGMLVAKVVQIGGVLLLMGLHRLLSDDKTEVTS